MEAFDADAETTPAAWAAKAL